ncbi:MAG: lipopolysaccharide biosynthesis protein [Gemmatimonadales bacterium]
MKWAILQVGGRQLTSLLVFGVLGVLLAPRDFGLVGMAMAWLSIVQSFSDLGLGAALIQRREIGPAHFSTVFLLNVGVGAALTVLGVALSWPVASFFHEPALQPVAMALSLNFVIGSMSAAQSAVAQRELRFRELAARDIAASAIGGGFGIALAATGWGVWSLVAQSLITGLVAAILIWPLSAWRPKLGEYSTALLREMWPYSSQLFMFNVFKSFVQNLDRLLLGHLLGPVAVGLYVFAYRLVVQPIATLVGAVGTYLFPYLSRLQADPEGLRRAYGDAMRGLAAVALPLAILSVVGAPVFVPMIWGTRWLDAVTLIQVMGVLAIFQAYVSPVGQLLKSLDRPRWLLWWSVGITALVALLLWAGVQRGGVSGAVWGITIAYALGSVVIVRMTDALIRFGARDLWRISSKPLAAAVAMVATAYAVDRVLGAPSWAKAATIALLPLAAYCAVLLWLDHSLLGGLTARLRTLKPSGARS